MSNVFMGEGSVGKDPVTKEIIVKGETKRVLELRVMFDTWAPDGEGGFRLVNGFWQQVSIWRESLIDNVMSHVRKGARIVVIGSLKGEQWTDKETDEDRFGTSVVADQVALCLGRIDSVKYRAPRAREEGA